MHAGPDRIRILQRRGALQSGGDKIAAVAVFQFRRGNGDGGIGRVVTSLCSLIGHGLGTGFCDHFAVSGGVDIGAAGGGIDRARRGVNGAVDLHQRVLLPSLDAVAAGCVGQLHVPHIAARAGFERIVVPIVHVIDDDPHAVSQRSLDALADIQLRAGQQGDILLDAHGPALGADGHVGGDGEVIVFGVQSGAADQTHLHGHGQRLDGKVTVGGKLDPSRALDVILDDIAGTDLEHGVAAGTADHGHAGALQTRQGDGGRHIGKFLGARMDRHGNFNVLEIILGHGEHAVAVAGHCRGHGAAAEIRQLEILIDRSAALDLHGAGAGDIAPGVEVGAALDGDVAAGLHVDEARRAGDAAVAGRRRILASGNAQAALHGQVRAGIHGQRAVSGDLHPHVVGTAVITGRIGIHGIGRVEGDQQRHARRDGIVPRREGGVVQQHHRFIRRGDCSRSRLVQVVVNQGLVHQEIRLRGGENGFDRHVFFRGIDGVGRRRGQPLSGRRIHPAHEGHAAVGRCRQRDTSVRLDAFHHRAVTHRRAGSGDAAPRAVKGDGHVGGIRRCRQADVAQLQGGRTGVQTLVAGQHQLQRSARIQHDIVVAGGAETLPADSKGVVSRCLKVERQLRLLVKVVGNGNVVCLAAEQAALGGDGHRAAGLAHTGL